MAEVGSVKGHFPRNTLFVWSEGPSDRPGCEVSGLRRLVIAGYPSAAPETTIGTIASMKEQFTLEGKQGFFKTYLHIIQSIPSECVLPNSLFIFDSKNRWPVRRLFHHQQHGSSQHCHLTHVKFPIFVHSALFIAVLCQRNWSVL
jgi:hypothetical protein